MPVKVGRNGQKPAHAQPRRYMAWLTFEGSGPEANRYVGQGLKEKGWRWFVENKVDPLEKILAPEDAIVLHCPFGRTPGVDTMEADQAIKAAHTHTYLLDGFQSAWLPVCQRREVICYFGSLSGTAEFVDLLTKRQYGMWLARVSDSYRMALGCGMKIGFDAMHRVPEWHPAFSFVRLAKSLTGAFVEPVPTASDTHMADLPWIVMEDYWQQHFRPWPSFALPEKELTGERIRAMNSPPNGKWEDHANWLPQWIASCWKGGWTPANGQDWFLEQGVTVRDAVEKYL